MRIHPAGENALIVYLGEAATPVVSAQVQALAEGLQQQLGADLIDVVPSYASLLVIYDPLTTDHMAVSRCIRAVVAQGTDTETGGGALIELPVYYHSEVGEDLESLAEAAQLSIDDVIGLHSGAEYRVYAIGFAPGFAYLGEVDERIAAPRLATPRQRVPRGAVAIADRQTAVYPAPSPGGWNLIGRCPIRMFDPDATPTMPVGVGDRVRFVPVTREEYLTFGGEL